MTETATKPRPTDAKPCATCPFLRANIGKPNPPGWEEARERDGFESHDWYSAKNLRRLWDGFRREGATLQCHCTVEDHAGLVGKVAKPGAVRLCAGALWVTYRHVSLYERIVTAASERGQKLSPTAALRIYKRFAGRFPMTADGMIAQVINLSMPPFFGGLPRHLVPESFHASVGTEVAVPWDDPLTNDPDAFRVAVAEATL